MSQKRKLEFIQLPFEFHILPSVFHLQPSPQVLSSPCVQAWRTKWQWERLG